MQTFDLIVIGSGPAGQRAAIQAAKTGKRVTLIEKREFLGGACINTGTIPSKTMREAVLHLSGFHYQNIYGINYRVKEKITMSDLSFRVQHVIKTEVDVTQAQLTRNGVEVLTGTASFVDPTHLRVVSALGQIDLAGDALLYAVGRQGNIDELNLGAAGVTADERGRIPVDAEYRTAQPHIYAAGDIIGFPSLASVSMEQGRLAAAHAFGLALHSNPA